MTHAEECRARRVRHTTLSRILFLVAADHCLSTSQLLANTRAEPLSTIRQIAMFLCRELTKASYPEIAEVFLKKHHGTVIHACEAIGEQAKTDLPFRRKLDRLHASISQDIAPKFV